MKRIEDEDEKKEFDKVWVEFNNRENFFETFREECEHFYVEGRDSLAREFWTAKPKRTISNIIKLEGSFFAISSDGKMFSLERNIEGERVWVPYPDLPQED